MKEYLDAIPHEYVVVFITTVGTVVSAVIMAIVRKAVGILEKYAKIRVAESAMRQVDFIAAWAAGATEQAFKKMLWPDNVPTTERNKEKLQSAIKEARMRLPASVSEKFTDEDLTLVIESKVAQSKPPPPMPVSPSNPPPPPVPPLPPPPKFPKL